MNTNQLIAEDVHYEDNLQAYLGDSWVSYHAIVHGHKLSCFLDPKYTNLRETYNLQDAKVEEGVHCTFTVEGPKLTSILKLQAEHIPSRAKWIAAIRLGVEQQQSRQETYKMLEKQLAAVRSQSPPKSSLERQFQELQLQLAQKDEEWQEKSEECTILEEKLDWVQAQLDQERKSKAELESKLASLQSSSGNADRIKELEDEISSMRKEQASKAFQSLEAEREKKLLEEKIGSLEDQLKQAQRQRRSTLTADQKAELQKLEDDCVRSKKENIDMSLKLEAKERERKILEDKVNSLEEQLKESQNKRRSTLTSEQKSEFQQLQQECNKSKRDLMDLSLKFESKVREEEQQRHLRMDAEERVSNLEKELQKRRRSSTNEHTQREDIKRLQSVIDQQLETMQIQKSEMVSLQQQLAELQKERTLRQAKVVEDQNSVELMKAQLNVEPTTDEIRIKQGSAWEVRESEVWQKLFKEEQYKRVQLSYELAEERCRRQRAETNENKIRQENRELIIRVAKEEAYSASLSPKRTPSPSRPCCSPSRNSCASVSSSNRSSPVRAPSYSPSYRYESPSRRVLSQDNSRNSSPARNSTIASPSTRIIITQSQARPNSPSSTRTPSPRHFIPPPPPPNV